MLYVLTAFQRIWLGCSRVLHGRVQVLSAFLNQSRHCCNTPSDQCTLSAARVDLQVPWEDLQYLFGEIIYGGHIVEGWDR